MEKYRFYPRRTEQVAGGNGELACLSSQDLRVAALGTSPLSSSVGTTANVDIEMTLEGASLGGIQR